MFVGKLNSLLFTTPLDVDPKTFGGEGQISAIFSNNKNYIQSNLGFQTSRSSNNSVFERKIRDENHSVLQQKFGSQTTQEKDLPEPSAAPESILCGPRTFLKL